MPPKINVLGGVFYMDSVRMVSIGAIYVPAATVVRVVSNQ